MTIAHLVSRFACNTRVIVDASSIKSTGLQCQNRSNINLESIHQVNKQTLHHQSISQSIKW